MAITAAALKSQVQVNIPFSYLWRGYLELFLELGLNPEIGLDAYSLGHYPPAVFRRAARAFQTSPRRITLHAPFQDLVPGALDDAVLAASRRRLRQAWRYLPVFRPRSMVAIWVMRPGSMAATPPNGWPAARPPGRNWPPGPRPTGSW